MVLENPIMTELFAGLPALCENWNSALKTGVPEEVAKMYMDTAVLVPTVSGDVRTSFWEIADYFVKFLENEPTGAINEYNIRVEGLDKTGQPHSVSNHGIYTFTFAKTGVSVQGRFSYVYQKVGTRWMITHHHSSELPELEKPN